MREAERVLFLVSVLMHFLKAKIKHSRWSAIEGRFRRMQEYLRKNQSAVSVSKLSVGHFSLSVSVWTSFNVFLGLRSITRGRKKVPLTSLNECILFLKNKIGSVDHLKCMHSGAWFKTSLGPICLRHCFVYFFSLSQSRRRRILTIRRSLWGTSGAAMGEETPLLNAKKTTSTVGFVFMFIFF